jgi:iron complex outermembrane receptor protein
VWGKNLTDKRYPSALFGTPFGGKGDYSQVLTGDAFRRYGVTLNLRY